MMSVPLKLNKKHYNDCKTMCCVKKLFLKKVITCWQLFHEIVKYRTFILLHCPSAVISCIASKCFNSIFPPWISLIQQLTLTQTWQFTSQVGKPLPPSLTGNKLSFSIYESIPGKICTFSFYIETPFPKIPQHS